MFGNEETPFKPTVESVLSLFKQLNPRDQLDQVMLLLEMPEQFQPGSEVRLDQRESRVVTWAKQSKDGLEKLDVILRTLIDEGEGEGEGYTDDPWIIKTLDHKQAKPLRDCLENPGASGVAVVEGCSTDLPDYLADDVFLDPWPALDHIPQKATTLDLTHYGEDEHAFWSAVHQKVPCTQRANERAEERAAVCAWLREHDCHLFYLLVGMSDEGWRLPRLIRAARAFLAELSRREPGMGLLLLIACQPRKESPPWWWPLWRRHCRHRMPEVLWLEPLRALESNDVARWYNGFSEDAKRVLSRDRLRADLLDLFEGARIGMRYQRVRQRLLDEGALKKAQIRR